MQGVSRKPAQTLDIVSAVLLIVHAHDRGRLHGGIDASGIKYECFTALRLAEMVGNTVHQNHIAGIHPRSDDGFTGLVTAQTKPVRGFGKLALLPEVLHDSTLSRRYIHLAAIAECQGGFREEQVLGVVFYVDDVFCIFCCSFDIGTAQRQHVPRLTSHAGNFIHGMQNDTIQAGLHGACRYAEGLHIVRPQTQENNHDDQKRFHHFGDGASFVSGYGVTLHFYQFDDSAAFCLIPVQKRGLQC